MGGFAPIITKISAGCTCHLGGFIKMTILAYVLGSVLMLVSVALVVLVLFQNAKKHGLSGAIGGTTGDSYFGKNQGQTKEKKLSRLTTIACAVFAVVAIAAYIICS